MQPESKFLTSYGEPYTGGSRGLLCRRHVHVLDVLHIGKEANEIDKVQADLLDSEDDVLLTFERDLWEYIQSRLSELPISLIHERTGYSKRMIYALRRGERRPSKERLEILLVLVAERSREILIELGSKDVPKDDRMAVVMYGRLLRREDRK